MSTVKTLQTELLKSLGLSQRAIAEAGALICQCGYCVGQRAKQKAGQRTVSEKRLPLPEQERDSPFILPSETKTTKT